MKSSAQMIVLGVLTTLPALAAAADAGQPGAPDTSQWKCESCKFEDGQSGAVEVGAGYVSDKSAKFGEYTGLREKGGFFIGEGAVRARRPDGSYWTVDAANLGLDSRSVDAEGGRQGEYKLRFSYEELPHFLSDTAQTPYSGAGSASLTLPAGFPAANTGAMPLGATLQSFDIHNKRERAGLGASWIPAKDWEAAVSFRHETRDGTRRTAGAFFVNAAQLFEPLDYTTDQVDASLSHRAAKWEAKIAYYGSLFRNSNSALTFQNPFTSIIPGDVAGQLALPPDNQFHQLLASAGYQFSEGTRASADIAGGRMTQNEGFLAATLNPTAGFAPALPASSLDGRADTLNASAKLTSALTDRLRLNALLAHDERENRTAQSLYSWVSTDMFNAAVPRTNLPYSFRSDRARLSADYRVTQRLRASVGVDGDTHERTYQETERMREVGAWGKLSSQLGEKVDLTFKAGHSERRNTDYHLVPGITPAENPLLRKYNMADRNRNTVGLRADIAALENINIGLGFDTSRDSYLNSPIGLTESKDYSINGDAILKLFEKTSVQLFASHQAIRSKQANSQAFSVPDWSGENIDIVNVIGLGVKQSAIVDKLDVGADYSAARSRSEIRVNTALNNPAFPDLLASLHTLKLYATYRLRDNVSLNAGYWHEFYNTHNWMLEGVSPATLPNVLTLGEQPPRYNLHVLRVSVRYSF